MNHESANRRRTSTPFSYVIAGLGLAAMAFWLGQNVPLPNALATEATPEAVASARDLSTAFRHASRKVLPSVVTIYSESTGRHELTGNRPELPEGLPPEMEPFFRRFFEERGGAIGPDSPQRPRRPRQAGMGSGVIIDDSGIILTNNHVVSSGDRVRVRLQDGREFDAVEWKTDPKTDIAVVRIEGADNLTAARIGNSDSVEVGDWVLAIGAPFGLQETVTAGIISAKSRGIGITEREEFLQTDAAINPGNSGGPLVNLDGDVIGINTAISSRGGGNDGVGFAVPVSLATWVSDQLIANGQVQRAFLGVGIQPVRAEISEQLGLEDLRGVLVTEVRTGTAAAEAGLEPGDVIVSFNGQSVSGPRDLQKVVERAPLKTKHSVEIIRDGRERTLKVELQALMDTSNVQSSNPSTRESVSSDLLGCEVGPLSDDVARQLDLENAQGVVITSVTPGGLAAEHGLEPGMVISRVGRQDVTSVEEFEAALEAVSPEEGILLLVRTSAGSRFLVLESR